MKKWLINGLEWAPTFSPTICEHLIMDHAKVTLFACQLMASFLEKLGGWGHFAFVVCLLTMRDTHYKDYAYSKD